MKHTSFLTCNKTIHLYEPEGHSALPLFVYHADDDEPADGEKLLDAIKELTDIPFSLAVISGIDWFGDMSPWPAAPAFKKGPAFTGGADTYLKELTEQILPVIKEHLTQDPAKTILAGYSLAGLFAFYAGYCTDAFYALASVSGSLWYEGFDTYMASHTLSGNVKAVYFSLGDKEPKTRNPLLSLVGEKTQAAWDLCRQQGIDSVFEWNPGNHYTDPAPRVAKAAAWVLGKQ